MVTADADEFRRAVAGDHDHLSHPGGHGHRLLLA